jgi:hypothetical protein
MNGQVGEALIKSQLENAMLPGLRAENQLLHQATSKLKVATTSCCAVLCINCVLISLSKLYVHGVCEVKEQATVKMSPETTFLPFLRALNQPRISMLMHGCGCRRN